jgi:tyrosinase
MERAYAPTQFELFASSRPDGQNNLNASWQRRGGGQGPFEAMPHNGVHSWIGGNMSTMYSPRDPLFWLHHSNCDRIWAEWVQRGNRNTIDQLWGDFTFRQNFARPDHTLYDVVIRSLQDILALGYHYDRTGPQPGVAASLFAAAASVPSPATSIMAGSTTAAPVSIETVANDTTATLQRPLSVRVRRRRSGGASSQRPTTPADGSANTLVRLSDIPGPQLAGSSLVRVFVNHPSINPNVPITDPHYVGTFTFFGTHAQQDAVNHHGEHGVHDKRPSSYGRFSFMLDLTPTLDRLRGLGETIGNTVTVQIVPVATRGAIQQVEIKPAAVELLSFGG